MKYKIVSVYTGYAENSITSIEEREDNCTLKEMHEKVLKEDIEGAEYFDPEFYGTPFCDTQAVVQASKNVGTHNYGEEDILIIVPETNVWFNKLIVDQMGKVDIDEVTYNDWVEFVNSLQ